MILLGGPIPIRRDDSKSPERGCELARQVGARLRVVVRGIRVTARVAETSLPDKDNLPKFRPSLGRSLEHTAHFGQGGRGQNEFVPDPLIAPVTIIVDEDREARSEVDFTQEDKPAQYQNYFRFAADEMAYYIQGP
jgi:hypothetical protein